jgi:hypothetical protein
MKFIPLYVLNYIFTFAPEHREKYKKVMHELVMVFIPFTIINECHRKLYDIHHYNTFLRLSLTRSSDYIDFIRCSDMKNSSIAYGLDNYNRPFFSLKVRVICTDNTYFDTFSTFFQRYTVDRKLWMCCGHDGQNLMNSCGGMSIVQLSILIHLLLFKKKKILAHENEVARILNFTDVPVKFLKILT